MSSGSISATESPVGVGGWRVRSSSGIVDGDGVAASTSERGGSGYTETGGSLGAGSGAGIVRGAGTRSMIGAGRLVVGSGAQDNAAAATNTAAATRPATVMKDAALCDASMKTRCRGKD